MNPYTLMLGDCLTRMSEIPSASIDMVMADLPYGTTQNKWDSVIPLARLWEAYRRVCRGAVVLTAAQPFTSVLVCSNLGHFKYDWVWEKGKATGHLNASLMPLRAHEHALVFACGEISYFPQMVAGEIYKHRGGGSKNDNYGDFQAIRKNNGSQRFPRSVQKFSHANNPVHPTQKPVALMEYLIRTYTNPGDTVLDNTMGSGTTGVAALQTGRRFIGIERDEAYFAIAEKRIAQAYLETF